MERRYGTYLQHSLDIFSRLFEYGQGYRAGLRVRISVLPVGPYPDPEGQIADFLHKNLRNRFLYFLISISHLENLKKENFVKTCILFYN
jgi:hypothetical protein